MVFNIILPKNFESSKLVFSDVKTNNYGGKVVYINYDGKPFRIQTPEMTLPYGLNENEILDPKTNEVIGHKYSVNLSFNGLENNNKLKIFHKLLSDVDNLVISTAQENSLPWLKMKKCTEDTAMALYSGIIIRSKDKETQEPDGKYPDTFKGKIIHLRDQDKFLTEVYNYSKESIDLKPNIIKGSKARVIIECTGIWFAGGKFGVGWKIVQMVVENPEGLQGYSIMDSSDDDDDDCDENLVNDSDSD